MFGVAMLMLLQANRVKMANVRRDEPVELDHLQRYTINAINGTEDGLIREGWTIQFLYDLYRAAVNRNAESNALNKRDDDLDAKILAEHEQQLNNYSSRNNTDQNNSDVKEDQLEKDLKLLKRGV